MSEPFSINSGDWYFFVECSGCKGKLVIGPDKSRGKTKWAGASTLLMDCPGCRTQKEFPFSAVCSGSAQSLQ